MTVIPTQAARLTVIPTQASRLTVIPAPHIVVIPPLTRGQARASGNLRFLKQGTNIKRIFAKNAAELFMLRAQAFHARLFPEQSIPPLS